jgi:hypothetical protein
MVNSPASPSTVPSPWTLGAARAVKTPPLTNLSTSSSTLQLVVPMAGSRKLQMPLFVYHSAAHFYMRSRDLWGNHSAGTNLLANIFVFPIVMRSAASPGLTAARPLCVTFGRPTILGCRLGALSRIVAWLSSRSRCGRKAHAKRRADKEFRVYFL